MSQEDSNGAILHAEEVTLSPDPGSPSDDTPNPVPAQRDHPSVKAKPATDQLVGTNKKV